MGKSSKANNQEWMKKYLKKGELGTGGNATVFLVERIIDHKEYALKPFSCLSDKEKTARFENEVKVVNQLKDSIDGILPIVDYMIDAEKKEYWYVMPVAVEITDEKLRVELQENYNYTFIVNGIIELAETLSELHNKGHSHRDIKPENIYYYNGRFHIGDFGLVSFMDSEESFTKSRALGAYSTMAPEMRRDPHRSDGKKADVYSLAKTLWILLTGKKKGFDGVYDYRDKVIGLRYESIVSKIHIVELEELLRTATDNNPDNRPTMKEFRNSLEEWLSLNPEDFYSDEIQNSEWRFINNYLFGENTLYTPEVAIWEDIDRIRDVLALVASLPAFNHMMYVKGGLDFIGVENAAEEGCLYLYEEYTCNVVKPAKLIYCNFLEDTRWNYFLLELNELSPIIDKMIIPEHPFEILVEDFPAHYVSSQYSQYGVYDYKSGEPLPDGWRLVRRCMDGKFLLCPKFGPYNNIAATYDGRHTQCEAEMFREHIKEMIEVSRECKDYSFDEETALNRLFKKNPFEVAEPFDATDYNVQAKTKEEIESYIENNLTQWNFVDLIKISSSDIMQTSRFKIVYGNNKITFGIIPRNANNCYVLCKDGCFKAHCENDEIYYSESSVDAELLLKSIKERIVQACTQDLLASDIDKIYLSVQVEFLKYKPRHLFTQSEIETLMRNADDRHDNILVINTDGYAEIIQDRQAAHFYPVRHETWDAGNRYVGKYSSLSSLEDDYILSLQGWLLFLQYRQSVYMEYKRENNDVEALIKEIKKFY